MCSEYTKQFTNIKICDTRGCNEVSTTRIDVQVKDRKINLDVCKKCVSKFVDKEEIHIV